MCLRGGLMVLCLRRGLFVTPLVVALIPLNCDAPFMIRPDWRVRIGSGFGML